jgi:phospholipid/cholesterol/gamma-HCH transport system permease protein
MIARAVAGLGRRTRLFGADALDLTRFVGATLRSVGQYPATARPVWTRSVRSQILFTAVQALPFLGAVAALIGVTVIVQARAQGLTSGASDVLGRLLATVVVRELGPLLTAVVVIGRSGTAIAAELATNTVLGETDALEALGVDPLQYLVLPRVVGVAASVALLTILFTAITLAAGATSAWLLGQASLADYERSLGLALSHGDLALLLVKGTVFGAGIAVLCSYAGLLGERAPTEIPRRVTRGVVLSLMFVFVTSAVFSIALYV